MTSSSVDVLIDQGGWPLSQDFGKDEPSCSCNGPLVIPIPQIRLNAVRTIRFAPRPHGEQGASFDLDSREEGFEVKNGLTESEPTNGLDSHGKHSQGIKLHGDEEQELGSGSDATGSRKALSDRFYRLEDMYMFLKVNKRVQQETAQRLAAFVKPLLPVLDSPMQDRRALLAVFVWLACQESIYIEEEAVRLFKNVVASLKEQEMFCLALDVLCEFCRSVESELERPVGALKGTLQNWAQQIAEGVARSEGLSEAITVRLLSGPLCAASRIFLKALDVTLPGFLQKSLVPPAPPIDTASTSSNAVVQFRMKLHLNLNAVSRSEKLFSGEAVLVWLLWMMKEDGDLDLRLLQDSKVQERVWNAVREAKPLQGVLDEWGSSDRLALVCSLLATGLKRKDNASEHEVELMRLGGGSHGHVYVLNKCKAVKVVECGDLPTLGRALKEITILQTLRGVKNVVQILNYEIKDRCEAWITLERAKCSLLEYRTKIPKKLYRENYVHLLRLFKNIIQALHRLSEMLVIHNDLRCCNCLVSQSNEILIADFGEAVTLPDVTARFYEARGTEANSSPEMLRVCTEETARQKMQHFDRRRSYTVGVSFPSDIWASGCLLFELITGGELLYEEAQDAWPRFFTRLTDGEDAAEMDVIPEGRLDLVDAAVEQVNAVGVRKQVEELLRYILERDERVRPSPMAIVQKLDLVIGRME